MEYKLKRFNRIYPFFDGLSMDLLFWVAVDTLFLGFVKGFTAQQIVLTSTVARIVGIVLQLPIMWLVKKIGNTNAVRIGAVIDLLSALALTFGVNVPFIIIGRCLHDVALTSKSVVHVTLRHNLELQNKENEYIKYFTKATTIYGTVTMVIAAVASIMFNFYNYLPMICCIVACVVCVFMSFYMVDYNASDSPTPKIDNRKKVKIGYSKIIVFIFISFGLGYAIIMTGQEDTKLFIQDCLKNDLFSEESIALLIGVIVFVSRIVRVLANLLFNAIYEKIGDKSELIFGFILLGSFALLIFGSMISGSPIIKYSVMGFGFLIVVFLRDPFKIYSYDIMFKNSPHEQHSQLMLMLEYMRKIVAAMISLSFTAVLIKNPLLLVIVLYAVLAVLQIGIGTYLYVLIKRNSGGKEIAK